MRKIGKEEIKFYFEILLSVSTIVLAIATIFLAISTNNLAKDEKLSSDNQFKIMQGQLDQMKMENRPIVAASFFPGDGLTYDANGARRCFQNPDSLT
jgi:hypothetical protein